MPNLQTGGDGGLGMLAALRANPPDWLKAMPGFNPANAATSGTNATRFITSVPMSSGGGGSAYGGVPAPVTNVNPAALWSTIYPNLSADLSSALGITRSQLAGELTPEVQRAVTNAANARAVAGGVGGSPFAGSVIAHDLGLTTMNLQNQGVQNLQNQIAGIQSNLVQPNVDLQQANAVLAAAPNPAAAAAEQQRIYEQQQQRSFERQQQLLNQQFTQQMSYLNKYLSPSATAVGGGKQTPRASVSYYAYGPGIGGGALSSTPYSTTNY